MSKADLEPAARAARAAFYAPMPMTPWEECDERTQRKWRRVAREAIEAAVEAGNVVESDTLRELGDEWFRQASYDAGSYLTCKNEMLDLIPERNTP